MEETVKELTADIVEAKNHLGEPKKETNKLRLHKTALQNQLDKLKKDAEKEKSASPKKSHSKAL